MSCTKQTYEDTLPCPICRAKADVSGDCIPDDHYDAYEPTSCRIECSSCGLDSDDWSTDAGGFAFDATQDEYDAELVARAVAHYSEQLTDAKRWAVLALVVAAHDLDVDMAPLAGPAPTYLQALSVEDYVALRSAMADRAIANSNVVAVREVA